MSDTTGKKVGGGERTSGLLNELLQNENLEYNLPSAATVVVEKNQKLFFFDKTEYKNVDDRLVITLNSGSDFIDGQNSYLSFKVTVTNTSTGPIVPDVGDTKYISWGLGSAANLFSEIIIRSRDGSEIERVRDLNSLVLTRCHWTKSQDYINNKGSESGYFGLGDPTKDGVYSNEETSLQLRTGQDYVIPMRDLSSLFNVQKLLPSFLMSGLRIELVLAPPTTALVAVGGAILTEYTISNPIMRLETLKLSDSVMNQLTQNAANGGLVIPIDTWDLTRDTITGLQANIEVRRNVSQVLGVVVKTRVTESIGAAAADSLASEPLFKVADYRFRIGSQFIPNSAVGTKRVECYSLAQIAWNKYKSTESENAVSLKDYMVGGHAVIASDLERSAIDLSGVSISNSKVLAFEANYENSVARTISVYISFTRALTVFLTNTLVQD